MLIDLQDPHSGGSHNDKLQTVSVRERHLDEASASRTLEMDV